jgi:hypothetical protein
VVLLLKGALVSWLQAMDERSGHEDLCDVGHRSIIPYIYERIELYCSSLPCLSLPICPLALTDLFFVLMKRCLPGPFIAQGRVVIMRPGAQQVARRWLKPYTTSRALGVANDVLHDVSNMESSCLLTLLY